MALNSDEGWAYEQREIHGARSGTPYSRMHGTPRSGQEASDTLHIVLHRAFDLDLRLSSGENTIPLLTYIICLVAHSR